MAVDANSLKNLEKGTKFYSGDNRPRPGRPPGSRNRKTAFLQWLDFETDCTDPAGNEVQLPLLDKVVLAIISKAAKGDVTAANMVFDCVYGRIGDAPAPEQQPRQTVDWSRYTEEEVIQLTALIAKGTPGVEEIL